VWGCLHFALAHIRVQVGGDIGDVEGVPCGVAGGMSGGEGVAGWRLGVSASRLPPLGSVSVSLPRVNALREGWERGWDTLSQWSARWVDGEEEEGEGSDGEEGEGSTIVFSGLKLSESVSAQLDRLDAWRSKVFEDDHTRHVCAGTLARTAAQMFVHPIDTVKTRLQVSKPHKKVKKWRKKIKKRAFVFGTKNLALKFNNFMYKGPGDLYRGLGGNFVGTIPTAASYFMAYEAAKRYLESHLDEEGPLAGLIHVLSASAGAISSSVFRVPTDVVKHRVQAYQYPTAWSGVASIWTSQRIRGFYAGYFPTLIRDVPEIAIQFATYEFLRKRVASTTGVEKMETWQHLVLGGLSGCVAAISTMPLDVLKTRIQCGMTTGLGPVGTLVEMVEDKGFKSLFAGVGPRVAYVGVMSAVLFTLFEYSKLLLKPAGERSKKDTLLLPKIIRKKRDKVWKRQFVWR